MERRGGKIPRYSPGGRVERAYRGRGVREKDLGEAGEPRAGAVAVYHQRGGRAWSLGRHCASGASVVFKVD